MTTLNDLEVQLTAFTEALDRVADKIADVTDDALVKAALVRQYEELKRQKTAVESKIKDLIQSKIIG